MADFCASSRLWFASHHFLSAKYCLSALVMAALSGNVATWTTPCTAKPTTYAPGSLSSDGSSPAPVPRAGPRVSHRVPILQFLGDLDRAGASHLENPHSLLCDADCAAKGSEPVDVGPVHGDAVRQAARLCVERCRVHSDARVHEFLQAHVGHFDDVAG